jgi:hypothetical protein
MIHAASHLLLTKGGPPRRGWRLGGSELAYRSTALSLPSPDRGTNIMFCADGRLRSGVLIWQHLPTPFDPDSIR